MLQAIKRAFRLNAEHPKLHSRLILCYQYLNRWRSSLPRPVALVLQVETEPIFRGRDACQINLDFLDAHPDSLQALLEGMFYPIESLS